jgi:hypothetical protein
MIVIKTWERKQRSKNDPGIRSQLYIDHYTGWFLFGLIPLVVIRHRSRSWAI